MSFFSSTVTSCSISVLKKLYAASAVSSKRYSVPADCGEVSLGPRVGWLYLKKSILIEVVSTFQSQVSKSFGVEW